MSDRVTELQANLWYESTIRTRIVFKASHINIKPLASEDDGNSSVASSCC